MKKFLFSVIIAAAAFNASSIDARTVMQYQVMVGDNDGAPVAEKPVDFKILIREGSATGNTVLSEEVSTVTSPVGIAYLNIGAQSEHVTLDDLDWAGQTYFMEVSVDRGTGFQSLGCSQIMSVPRAIHAATASELVLKSPSGKKYKVTIDDNGQVSTQLISE